MKRISLILAILGMCVLLPRHSGTAYAQASDSVAGITEHLGNIIPLDLSFKNETGSKVLLRDIIKRPTLLVLVFFDCPGVCPTILSSVSDVIERLDMELGKDFQVVTVSFDPRDTPEKAIQKKKEYLRKKSRMHEKDWTYLTGDSVAIQELTRALGYHFQPAGNGFIHPACIMVLSPEGKITRYLYGDNYLLFDVKMALIEAQRGEARPTINRVLNFCFNYDPEGRRYTLAITKVSATVIIFFALILFLVLILRKRRKPSEMTNSSETASKEQPKN